MKILKGITISILMSAFCNAQSQKTYNGNYKDGTANYEYYENAQLERIFNGNFKYKSELAGKTINARGQSYQNIEIIGKFSDNLKDGKWTFEQTTTSDAAKSIKGSYFITQKVSGNYTKGKKHGLWIAEKSTTENGKVLKTSTFSCTFNLGVIAGVSNPQNKIFFDENGYYIDVWNIKKDDIEIIAEFRKGIYSKLIVRKMSDGKILKNYACPINLNNFNQDSIIKINDTIYKAVYYSQLSYIEREKLNANESDSWFEYPYSIANEYAFVFNIIDEKIELGSKKGVALAPKLITVSVLSAAEKRKMEDELDRKVIIHYADSMFSIGNFKYALINYKKAGDYRIDDDLKVKTQLAQKNYDAKKQEHDKIVEEADVLLKSKKFDLALNKYSEAVKFLGENLVDRKIKELKSEKEKHIKFLEERLSKKYTQNELETKQINDAIKQIESQLFDYLKKNPEAKLEEHGNILINIDTLGAIKNYIFTPFGMEQRKLSSLIDSEILKIKTNPIYLNNYTVSAELRFKLDIVSDNGKIKYDNIGTKIIVKKGEPSRSVISYLSTKHYGQEAFENKKIKYEFFKINDVVNFNELED